MLLAPCSHSLEPSRGLMTRSLSLARPKASCISLPELFPHPGKYGPLPEKAGTARELRSSEWSLWMSARSWWINPLAASSPIRGMTPRWVPQGLPEDLPWNKARVLQSDRLLIRAYPTSLICPNSPLPHIASWHHSLSKLPAPTSLCQGLLFGGIQTRRVNGLKRFSYTWRHLYFAFTMEGELAGYRILNS